MVVDVKGRLVACLRVDVLKYLGKPGDVRSGQAVKGVKALQCDTPIFSQEIGIIEQRNCTRQ